MPRILLVEDDQPVLEVLEFAFEDAGYEIIAVSTLAEARAELEQGRIACVFTDLFLQGESGLTIARTARERGIPTIIASGSAARIEELREDGWQVVPKPFRLAELIAAVEASLAADGLSQGCGIEQRFFVEMAQRCRELAAASPVSGLTLRLASMADEFESRAR